MIKDYDLDIIYHPGKVNVVADALSKKSQQEVTVARLIGEEWLREDGQLQFLEVRLELMSEILIA